ncbi:methyltransferase domain-containing protein [Streptomyces cupreus]|uniref:Class I SAM-dependent methyltransferase n=1 Tax=Streptomyces cupreus TaxID=2759956 RepID=A0A7X1J6I6_9ACTN|nr:class I SAM-dependent methyltransferase [Streptomyces cupreus]
MSEPRRDHCPWCGSNRLRTRLTGDGFALDECHDCAHVFQNPCRAPGTGDPYGHRRLVATARAMLPFPEPESWLDIGTGDAAFPAAAKEIFPYTSFDGVDPTARVERARAAGHVEEAYAGDLMNPHLMAHLRARYDVVSVLHHLPYTPNPREQLRAALTALRPGGHLLLELPDPQSPFAKLLGRWWHPRSRPRHLMPQDNIRTELDAGSCTIVTTAPARYCTAYRIIARKQPG